MYFATIFFILETVEKEFIKIYSDNTLKSIPSDKITNINAFFRSNSRDGW